MGVVSAALSRSGEQRDSLIFPAVRRAAVDAKLILVVDDHRDIRAALQSVLEHTGYRVIEAADGEEALRAASVLHPDLVLMDVAMPKMDGLTATRLLREGGFTGPIVGITALAGVHQDAVEAAFDAYLLKPVRARQVLDAVRHWIGPP